MGAKLSKLKLEGFDFNQIKYPELLEDEEMLKLVWADSNGTLIDTVPNSMPLWERETFTLSVWSVYLLTMVLMRVQWNFLKKIIY